MKKGARVFVRWLDIQADLHTDAELNPAQAESVGWILRDTKKVLELAYTRYTDGCKLVDKIAIVKGCVESIEEI